MTSFPERIKYCDKAIVSIMNQSFQPNKIILYLSEEQLSKKEKELPYKLLKFRKFGLEIRWILKILNLIKS